MGFLTGSFSNNWTGIDGVFLLGAIALMCGKPTPKKKQRFGKPTPMNANSVAILHQMGAKCVARLLMEPGQTYHGYLIHHIASEHSIDTFG